MAVYRCQHGQICPDIHTARTCDGSHGWIPTAKGGRVVHTAVNRVKYPNAEPTWPQLNFVRRLGGDVEYARDLSRLDCGQYIDNLKAGITEKPGTAPPNGAEPPAVTQAQTLVPLDLLVQVPNGLYAVRPDDTVSWVFLRISRPKRGLWAGTIKVQTQHADWYKTAMIVLRDKTIRWYQPQRRIEPSLLLLMADSQWAAIMYGQTIHRCCRCNISLTDEESRKYGIGPECVKYWPWVRERVDELLGSEVL